MSTIDPQSIKGYDWSQLIDVYQLVEDNQIVNHGAAFEVIVMRAFELTYPNRVRYGYSVPFPNDSLSGDQKNQVMEQIDGVVYADPCVLLIEAKSYAKPVSIDSIAKLRNQLLRRPSIVFGGVFSRNGFTPSALELARYCAPNIIMLWTGPHLKWCLQQNSMDVGLRKKFQHCIERNTTPDLNPAL